jgi:hypothetical protein
MAVVDTMPYRTASRPAAIAAHSHVVASIRLSLPLEC